MKDYIGQFGQSSDSIIGLAESIFQISKKHNDVVIELCQRVLNLDPANKKALKLKKQAEKGPGLLSKLFG